VCPQLTSTWIAWHGAKPTLPSAMVPEAGGTVSPHDKDVDGIQVVRVVEQDTMDTGYNGERSDSESTRKLVRGWV
jgi:hypothetical protein